MRKIISIEHIEFLIDRNGKKYARTHAFLDDGTVAQGYGKDFAVDDEVQVFLHSRWDVIKMRKPDILRDDKRT